MKIFPILYKRNTNKSINQWQITVIGNQFFTNEGLVNGVQTLSKPTTCEGKNLGKANETSAQKQALKEAESKFQKQIEKGYTEDINKVDSVKTFFEPMLCNKWDDYKDKIDFSSSLYAQNKIDGCRCICKKNGMWSRHGKPIISAQHIYDALAPYFQNNPNLIFDGELYCSKLNNDFNKIISLVRKTKPTKEDLNESKNVIQYWIYDLPSCEDIFSKRNLELSNLFKTSKPDCIIVHETVQIHSKEEFDHFHEQALKDGFEGSILRLDKMYENKRTKSILKRKDFIDDEFEIIDVLEGIGNRSGMAGYLAFKTKEGKDFTASIKGNFAYFIDLLKNKQQIIGKTATIKYFSLTPDKLPRFPIVVSIRDYE